MRRECGEFLWPWLGAPISKVFVVELTRKRSFLLGTQLLVSQHEQALLDLIVSRPLALLFFNTVFLRAQEDANVQVEKERTCNHIRTKTQQSLVNTRWKPCCILVAYTPALE